MMISLGSGLCQQTTTGGTLDSDPVVVVVFVNLAGVSAGLLAMAADHA